MDNKERNLNITSLDIDDLMTEASVEDDEKTIVSVSERKSKSKSKGGKEYFKLFIFVALVIMIQLMPINSEKFNFVSILIKALLIIAVLFLLFFMKN